MRKWIWLALASLTAACTVVPPPVHPPQPGPPPVNAQVTFDVVAQDQQGRPIPHPKIQVHTATGYIPQTGDAAGYALFVLGGPLPDSDVIIEADGFVMLRQGFHPEACSVGCHNVFRLQPAHVDPSTIPLEDLAAIRGAMWPLGTASSCGALPLGPRPGQTDNVIATVFITDYPAAVQDCIIAELKARGYTHVVIGPLVDSDGYHGIWPPNDWRGANFDRFLDAIQQFYDAGLAVVVFGKPDNWSLDQFRAEFTTLLAQPRAQRLIRIFVPMGWEAGAAYEYSSCTWAEAGRWTRAILPNALVLVHMVSDRDAPAGTDARCDDDDRAWNPGGNAAAWARVVPFYHGWLTQSGAFANPTQTGGDREYPELTNFQNWTRQFDPAVRGSYRDRFEHGYANWPMGSAWGLNQPLRVMAGEMSAYWRFWEHRTESEGMDWGDAAMCAGAAGYLDGGRVSVPLSADERSRCK